ncbi:MAG: phosphatidate cytidylyltransferase [Gemmataceae bacterium]
MSAPPVTRPSASSEVHTRVWVGAIMALLAGGVLILDHCLESWWQQRLYPFLLISTVLLIALSTFELHTLASALPRPPLGLCLLAALLVALAGWPAAVGWLGSAAQPWRGTAWAFALVVLAGFSWEMLQFRQPGGAVARLGLLTWLTAYLGLLPAFFVQLRFWPEGAPPLSGVAAMTLVIFVPKCCDIGAFFTGRALGRTPMTPLLSPKKTWEGLMGGLVLAMIVAVGVQSWLAPVFGSLLEAAGFGVVVGGVSVLGDLAESLIKRDCQKKDASHALPGFGGILDVVDSVLFAAPVAYWWLLGWRG